MNKNAITVPPLREEQLATVLAALQWYRKSIASDPINIPFEIKALATKNDAFVSLGEYSIDELYSVLAQCNGADECKQRAAIDPATAKELAQQIVDLLTPHIRHSPDCAVQLPESNPESDFCSCNLKAHRGRASLLLTALRQRLEDSESAIIFHPSAKLRLSKANEYLAKFFETGAGEVGQVELAKQELSSALDLLQPLPRAIIKALPAGPTLLCPFCEHDGLQPGKYGTGFRYLEDIVNYRQVVRVQSNPPLLLIEARYQTGEGYDDGYNGRIECRNCLGEFTFPESYIAEWI